MNKPAVYRAVIDEMVAAQPLIKPVVTSNGAVVVSGPIASLTDDVVKKHLQV